MKVRDRRRKIKKGDIITLQKSFKTDEIIKGKIISKRERMGYLTITWEDGKTSHVNPISQCILAVNGKSVWEGKRK